jgi:hypothetical protein
MTAKAKTAARTNDEGNDRGKGTEKGDGKDSWRRLFLELLPFDVSLF